MCGVVVCLTFGCSCRCTRSIPYVIDRRPLFCLRWDAVKIEDRLCKVHVTQGHTTVTHWRCHLVQPGVQKSFSAFTTSQYMSRAVIWLSTCWALCGVTGEDCQPCSHGTKMFAFVESHFKSIGCVLVIVCLSMFRVKW